jgi:hypothetical protein
MPSTNDQPCSGSSETFDSGLMSDLPDHRERLRPGVELPRGYFSSEFFDMSLTNCNHKKLLVACSYIEPDFSDLVDEGIARLLLELEWFPAGACEGTGEQGHARLLFTDRRSADDFISHLKRFSPTGEFRVCRNQSETLVLFPRAWIDELTRRYRSLSGGRKRGRANK